ncbi:hypothetical protein ACVW0P_000583 [Mucilaginibacter sp. UYNi724]
MKNLKPILKACSLILLLAFASCKKDGGVKPDKDPVINNTPVTATDLLGYVIPAQINMVGGLRIIYFNKDGNDIKATYDGVISRKIATVVVSNNILTLDLNGDGSLICTFEFSKSNTGELSLVKSTYKKQNDASVQMGAILYKKSDLVTFANLKFVSDDDQPIYAKFTVDHNFAVSDNKNYTGAAYSSYYDLCPGAWKGDYKGVSYMGICIKNNNSVVGMFFQKAGDKELHILIAQ